MTRAILAALAAAAILSGCTEASTGPIGNPAVYDRIEALTDCDELYREFDIAMDNVERYPGGDDRRKIPFAYANAASDRMRELGC